MSIKRTWFFVLLLVGMQVKAQTGLYVQASLNACNISATGYSTFQKAGLFASIGKSEDLDWLKGGVVQYGLAFSQKGARKVPDIKNGDYSEYNIRLNYLEVPVNFMFKMRSIKGLFGVSGGYLVNFSERGPNGVPLPLATHYRKIEVMGSMGFAVPVGSKVLLGLKGSMSLLPIVPAGSITSLAFARAARNQVISVGMTYVFVKKPPVSEDTE